MGMGFTRDQAMKALKATNNNLERAVDWIFSHQAEMNARETDGVATPPSESFRDGSSRKCSLEPSLLGLRFFCSRKDVSFAKLYCTIKCY